MLNITFIKFWRTEAEKEQGINEYGIIINNDEMIIDSEGKVVPNNIWDYRHLAFHGSLNLTPVINEHLRIDRESRIRLADGKK